MIGLSKRPSLATCKVLLFNASTSADTNTDETRINLTNTETMTAIVKSSQPPNASQALQQPTQSLAHKEVLGALGSQASHCLICCAAT
eukprot:6465289-Amphidinium_carterae.1